MSHANSFRPRLPVQHDISRLPQSTKDALDAVAAISEGEVQGNAVIWARPGPKGLARLLVDLVNDEETHAAPTQKVSMRVLDYRGVDLVAQYDIEPTALPALLGRLLQIYKRTGGSEEELLEMYRKDSHER